MSEGDIVFGGGIPAVACGGMWVVCLRLPCLLVSSQIHVPTLKQDRALYVYTEILGIL